MKGEKYNERICEMLSQGLNMAEIARRLNVSHIYIRKLVRNLVDVGVLIHNPAYSVHSRYKEVLKKYEKD